MQYYPTHNYLPHPPTRDLPDLLFLSLSSSTSPRTEAFLRSFTLLCLNKIHLSIFLYTSPHPNSLKRCLTASQVDSSIAPNSAFNVSLLQCSLPTGARVMFLFNKQTKTLLRFLRPGYTLDFIYLFLKLVVSEAQTSRLKSQSSLQCAWHQPHLLHLPDYSQTNLL